MVWDGWFEHMFEGVGVRGELPAAGPTPDGSPLRLQVECRTRRTTRGPKHPVTIQPDWTVETPHDLESERVAAAFGGYCSCLDLVDAVVPAAREATALLARTALPRLRHRPHQGWEVGDDTRCPGCARSWTDVGDAAEHVRSARHVAARYAAAAAPLRRVLAAVGAAHQATDAAPRRRDPRGVTTVREPGGLERLWRTGLHPDLVVRWWHAVAVPEPLPERFYLGAAFSGVDLDWLATTLAGTPDPDVATWLAWTDGLHDDEDPRACARWLAEGLPRRSIELLMRAGVTHASATAIAEVSWLPTRTVANRLAHWAAAGCTPEAEDFGLLERYGLADYRPSAPALDELCAQLSGVPAAPTRTQVGVMLALAGSRGQVQAHLEDGARSPQDLAERLDEPMGRPRREVG